MSKERMQYIRTLESLAPLHAHTNAIGIDENNRVVVQKKLSAPIDEFGIPRPEIMVEELLGQMTTKNYVWTGSFDEHHLATPKADFTVVRTSNEGDIGSAFRGLACLKVMLPRQMHNFSHHIFELPRCPSVDVMRQAVYEVGQARQLRETLQNYSTDTGAFPNERVKQFCRDTLHRQIEIMKPSELGLLPEPELLYSMKLSELRKTVNALLKVRRFSKKHLIHPAIRKQTPQDIKTAAEAA